MSATKIGLPIFGRIRAWPTHEIESELEFIVELLDLNLKASKELLAKLESALANEYPDHTHGRTCGFRRCTRLERSIRVVTEERNMLADASVGLTQGDATDAIKVLAYWIRNIIPDVSDGFGPWASERRIKSALKEFRRYLRSTFDAPDPTEVIQSAN